MDRCESAGTVGGALRPDRSRGKPAPKFETIDQVLPPIGRQRPVSKAFVRNRETPSLVVPREECSAKSLFAIGMGRLRVHAGARICAFSPAREPQIDRVLAWQERVRLPVVDITGGAPEMIPDFRYFVRRLREIDAEATNIDRCNLTILLEPGYDDLPEFLATQRVEVVASMPGYDQRELARRGFRLRFQSNDEAADAGRPDWHALLMGYRSGLACGPAHPHGGALLRLHRRRGVELWRRH